MWEVSDIRIRGRLAIFAPVRHSYKVQTSLKIQVLFPALVVFLPLTGCKTLDGVFGKKEEEPEEAFQQQEMKVPVGKVHVVSPGGDFVLIRSSKFLTIEPDRILTTIGSGGLETSRLRVSPARKGSFLTADIISGTPNVGDHTLMDYVARQNDPSADPFANDDEIQVLE